MSPRRRLGRTLPSAAALALAAGAAWVLSGGLGGPDDPGAATGPTTSTSRSASESATATSKPSPASTSAPSPADGGAAEQLAQLTVKGRGPMTGYSRERFGQAWSDAATGVSGARNGCDARNDVLRRDLDNAQLDPKTDGCVALAGSLTDPYSGQVIPFARGRSSAEVPIDHVVALGNAWVSGAAQLDESTRLAIATDPLNLQATTRRLNSQKSDGDAATWLPPAKGYRCEYVARQVAVKDRYRLSVTPAERDAITRVLATCPGQPAAAPADWDVP